MAEKEKLAEFLYQEISKEYTADIIVLVTSQIKDTLNFTRNESGKMITDSCL